MITCAKCGALYWGSTSFDQWQLSHLHLVRPHSPNVGTSVFAPVPASAHAANGGAR